MKMKKRTAIWAGLVATAMCVIFASSGFLFLQRNQEGFIFADQKGDASVLARIRVTGVLKDSFHRVSFSSHGMNFEHRALRQTMFQDLFRAKDWHPVCYYFEPLPEANVTREKSVVDKAWRYNPDGSATSTEQQTILTETADAFLLCLTGNAMPAGYHSYRVKTQVSYHREVSMQYVLLDGKKETGTNPSIPVGSVLEVSSHNLVQMNNRWYAITAADADCRGTGGIYDVTDFVNLPLSGEESPAMVEQENLYPIELDGGKNEILSMESCGENLAVFISVNGRMTMRIVNPQTWETEHIVALLGWGEPMPPGGFFAKGEYAVLVRFLEPEVQADVESSGENTTLRQIDIVNLESGAVVKQFQDSSPLARMGVMDALYIDDTLYLISFMTPPDNPAGKAQNQQPSGWTVDLPVLSVYREGEQIFACMIQSGQQEDARVKAPEARRYSELYLQPAEGGR